MHICLCAALLVLTTLFTSSVYAQSGPAGAPNAQLYCVIIQDNTNDYLGIYEMKVRGDAARDECDKLSRVQMAASQHFASQYPDRHLQARGNGAAFVCVLPPMGFGVAQTQAFKPNEQAPPQCR